MLRCHFSLLLLNKFEIKKAPNGKSESTWSLHIGSFWKIHFINPPEVQGQVVGLLIYGLENDDAKISKFPIGVNRKIADCVPLYLDEISEMKGIFKPRIPIENTSYLGLCQSLRKKIAFGKSLGFQAELKI